MIYTLKFSFRTTFFALFAAVMLFACKNETPKVIAKALATESLKIHRNEGSDCQKPDSLRTDCATLDFSYPSLKEGSAPLKKNVSAWVNSFLVGMLAPETEEVAPMPLDTAIRSFFNSYAADRKERPDFPGSYYAESWDSVLYNTGSLLTLKMLGETYMGGAHGAHLAAVGTFDAQTGHKLNWADLVTDTVAVKALAEKKFREERADIFKPSEDGTPAFNFDDTFPFALPQNYGLTDKGIYCHYVHYEVAPYALGSTAFVLTFEELGALYKK